MDRVYSIIDIETTGGHSDGNKITEIAIINFDGKEIIEEFSTLINPEKSIPYWITKLTGIDNEMVATAPKFFEIAKKIVQMTEGNVFVAHNVFFDYNFIRSEFNDLGFNFRREKLCTVKLARKFLPGHKSYSLGKICNDLDIKIEGRHRALGDAKATVELLKKILSRNEVTLKDQIDSRNKILLPSGLDRSEIEKLPSLPGVYYFYSEAGELLYVGKSKDIHKRVCSHFRVDMKRKKDIELKNKVHAIDFKVLGNELAALLFECQEIKDLSPPFNTALKRKKFPIGIKKILNHEGEIDFKVETIGVDEDYILKVTNKNKAKNEINKIFQSVIGVDRDSMHFENSKNKLISVIGIEKYNELILKKCNEFDFKESNFQIKLKGRSSSEKCIVDISEGLPAYIHYYQKSLDLPVESIKLNPNPDLKNIILKWNS